MFRMYFQYWEWSSSRQIRNGNYCLRGNGTHVFGVRCQESEQEENKWMYSEVKMYKDSPIMCLTIPRNRHMVKGRKYCEWLYFRGY